MGLRITALAFATVIVLALGSPGASAEKAGQGHCDSTGKLVCAAADVGGNVECSVTAGGVATCTWTYGWIVDGFSPAQLPGEESHTVSILVTICGPSGCATSTGGTQASCAWLPANSCQDSQEFGSFTTSAQLAFGQQLSVHVDGVVDVTASTGLAGHTVASASFHAADGGAGAVSYDDTGRG